MRGIRGGGPTMTTRFLLRGGREERNATKNGPSSARQRNAIEMAFRWRVDNGPPLSAGLVAPCPPPPPPPPHGRNLTGI